MHAYSRDLRERIVAAVTSGLSPREVAGRFAVGVTTVKRYVRLAAADELAPKPRPGRPRTIPHDQEDALEAQLDAHPDATLAEHCRLWEASQGMRVSVATMYRAITRLGWTRKKRRWQPPSARRQLAPSGGPSTRATWPTSSSSSMRPVPTSP